MPTPTVYTELTLAAFMKTQLEEVADLIGWQATNPVAGSHYEEPVNETMLSYGQADIVNAIDIRKIRSLARREIWRAVMQSTAGNYRFGSDREMYFRNQIYDHAKAQFSLASIDASIYDTFDPRYRVAVIDLIDIQSPYELAAPVDADA